MRYEYPLCHQTRVISLACYQEDNIFQHKLESAVVKTRVEGALLLSYFRFLDKSIRDCNNKQKLVTWKCRWCMIRKKKKTEITLTHTELNFLRSVTVRVSNPFQSPVQDFIKLGSLLITVKCLQFQSRRFLGTKTQL